MGILGVYFKFSLERYSVISRLISLIFIIIASISLIKIEDQLAFLLKV